MQATVRSMDGSFLERLLVEEQLTGHAVLKMFSAFGQALADGSFIILPQDTPLFTYGRRIGQLHLTVEQRVQVAFHAELGAPRALDLRLASQAKLGHVMAELEELMRGDGAEDFALASDARAKLLSRLLSSSVVLLWDSHGACCQFVDQEAARSVPILDLLDSEPFLMESQTQGLQGAGEHIKLRLAPRSSCAVINMSDDGPDQFRQSFWVTRNSSIETLRQQLLVLLHKTGVGELIDVDGTHIDPTDPLDEQYEIVAEDLESPKVACSLRFEAGQKPVVLKLRVKTSSPEDDEEHQRTLRFASEDYIPLPSMLVFPGR